MDENQSIEGTIHQGATIEAVSRQRTRLSLRSSYKPKPILNCWDTAGSETAPVGLDKFSRCIRSQVYMAVHQDRIKSEKQCGSKGDLSREHYTIWDKGRKRNTVQEIPWTPKWSEQMIILLETGLELDLREFERSRTYLDFTYKAIVVTRSPIISARQIKS